jgi:hypothetical protein
MKLINLTIAVIVIIILAGCGKPTTPEVVNPITDGGYKIISRLQTAGYAQDVIKKDNLLYIAQGEGGLMIVDVNNPVEPAVISEASEGIRGYASKIDMKDSVVYICAGSFGVSVVNVANPEHPIVSASNLSIKPAKNFHITGNYLFTAISELGVKIANISYPMQPDERKTIEPIGFARGVTTSSDTNLIFIACGEMGLSVYNISDFQDGFGDYPFVGMCNTPDYAESVVTDDEKSLAFMACGTAGLQIINYSDTTDIHIVGSYDGPGYAKELVLENNLVYMTAEKGGLQIIDVTDPANPELLGLVETEYALGIIVDNDLIYIADKVEGLIIVEELILDQPHQ